MQVSGMVYSGARKQYKMSFLSAFHEIHLDRSCERYSLM